MHHCSAMPILTSHAGFVGDVWRPVVPDGILSAAGQRALRARVRAPTKAALSPSAAGTSHSSAETPGQYPCRARWRWKRRGARRLGQLPTPPPRMTRSGARVAIRVRSPSARCRPARSRAGWSAGSCSPRAPHRAAMAGPLAIPSKQSPWNGQHPAKASSGCRGTGMWPISA